MNRADFRKLAELRIKEAKVLLDARSHAGAYYLAGYAVECAIKACIAKRTKRSEFPPDPQAVRDMYVHDVTKLLKPADLNTALDQETRQNPQFLSNWSLVKSWSEQSRYETTRQQTEARD